VRALITGSGGFCGGYLTEYLSGQSVEVYKIGVEKINSEHYLCIDDITSVKMISSALEKIKPDYLFHLAGIMHSNDPALFYKVNTQYAVSLIHAMKITGMHDVPLLLVGSSAEYGNVSKRQLPVTEDIRPDPFSHYGISKLAQTMAGLSASGRGMSVVIARPFNIIGPGMSENLAVGSFAGQIARIIKNASDPVIKVGNIKSSRDFIDVEDVVKIYFDLIQNPSAYGNIINVCSGGEIVIEDALSILIKLSGAKIDISTENKRVKGTDITAHYGSVEKMKKYVKHNPATNIETSLKRILDHQLSLI